MLAIVHYGKESMSGRTFAIFETRHTRILRETFSGILAESRAHTAFQPIDSSCGYVSRRIEGAPITRHVRSQHF
ncbi:hypothetical protein [Burkholderia cenocepacia]|uniref:hypothetical protein n=1 Tax=Burkholderia cenocepacia TaxID=95486 RepID=UPI0013DF0C15|nr:hypothetical protein [Burkholderia cenocepacia]MCW3585150.1 hypothetical protein [Burkholderia cenocepacia]MCW3630472.1 hypothetical protein [Burkholderia cenocepacia]MCW5178756.1 hypothetical protein [Burkholderia cenocepacia]